jgi:TRAP-type C4-dicarboxylate transport system permease small subunit
VSEAQQRAAATVLGCLMTAGLLAFMWGAYKTMRESLAVQRQLAEELTERADLGLWQAEVGAAGDAAGEGA